MNKKPKKNLHLLLKQLGFDAMTDKPDEFLYNKQKLVENKKTEEKTENTKAMLYKLTCPWILESWHIVLADDQIETRALNFSLDLQILKQAITETIQNKYGQNTIVEYANDPDGGIWCLFEFAKKVKPNRKQAQFSDAFAHGFAGFRFFLNSQGQDFSIGMVDHFSLGHTPPGFLASIAPMFRQIFTGPHIGSDHLPGKTFNMFEYIFSPAEAAHLALAAKEGMAEEDYFLECHRRKDELHASMPIKQKEIYAFRVQDKWGTRMGEVQKEPPRRRLPIEILETRELVSSHQKLETLLLDGNVDLAFEELQRQIVNEPQTLYLTRRACLLGRLDDKVLEGIQLHSAHAMEPENVLFLSGQIATALKKKDKELALASLSRLGEILYYRIPEAEEFKSFGLVIPKILGDCWFKIDPEKAKACYLRIIERRGKICEILNKLAELSQSIGDQVSEITYLEQLAEIEESPEISSEIFYRLLKVNATSGKDPTTAIRCGKECLKRDPQNIEAALLTAEILVASEAPEEALEILNHTLESLGEGSTDRHGLSLLEASLGSIWFNHMRRPDLGKSHFRKSADLDEKNLKALENLERIFRAEHNHEELVKILTLKFRAVEKSIARDKLQVLKDEIISLYSNELGQSEKAFEVFLSLSDEAAVDADEIERMLLWEDSGIDWDKLYSTLLNGLKKVGLTDELGRIHANLAKLCRLKLYDNVKAAHHLQQALEYSVIAEDQFDFLTAHLKSAKETSKLANVLRTRIKQVDDAHKSDLMKQILSLEADITADERDAYATQLILLQPNDRSEMFKRVNVYRLDGNLPALERLGDRILKDFIDQNNNDFWLNIIIEAIANLKDQNRFAALERYMTKYLDNNVDDHERVLAAIEIMKASPKPSHLKPLIERLLPFDLIPHLDFSMMIQMLEPNSESTGRLYYLQSMQEKSPALAADMARKAAQIFSQMPLLKTYEEKSLGRACSIAKARPEDIARLRELVSQSHSWRSLIQALEKQIELNTEPEALGKFFEEIGAIYKDKLNRPKEALIAYENAQKYAQNALHLKLEVVNLVQYLGNSVKEKELLVDCLKDIALARKPEILSQIIDRLRINHNETAAIENYVFDHIKKFSDAGDDELAGKLSDILLQRNIDHANLKQYSFLGAVKRRELSEAKKGWADLASELKTIDEVTEFLESSKKLLDDNFGSMNWEELVAESLQPEHFKRLPVAVNLELKLSVGLILFNSERHSNKAIQYLSDVKRSNPSDARIWIPLYLLVREYGDDLEIFTYLREIIPLVKRNPSLIKAYPITLESLQAEYERLTKTLKASAIHVDGLQDAAGFGGEGFASKTANLQLLPIDPSDNNKEETPIEDENWRNIIRSGQVPNNFAASIFDRPFSSAIEKHVALQASALLSGDMKILQRWHWQVWRTPDQFGYPLSGRDRYPEESTPELLNSPLHRLVMMLAPAFVKIFRDRFTNKYLARKLNIDRRSFPQIAQPIDWNAELFQAGGLRHYTNIIAKQKFQIFSMPGLNEEIFYEGRSRTFFFDAKFYESLPNTVLFHRLFGLMWSIKLNYYVALRLHPQKEATPMLLALTEILNENGLARLKNILGIEQNAMTKAIADLDRDELVRLFSRAGQIDELQITKLWTMMREQVYRLQIAETLDVVGVFEAISGRDLVDGNIEPGEILQMSKYIQHLLLYLTELKI